MKCDYITTKKYFFLQKKVLFFSKKKYFYLQKKVLFFGKKKYFFLAKKSTSRHVTGDPWTSLKMTKIPPKNWDKWKMSKINSYQGPYKGSLQNKFSVKVGNLAQPA